jgi:hypothetical protein
MSRFTFALLAVLALARAAAAQTQAAPPAAQPGDDKPPMRFEWVREGPADKCKDQCREWISAAGRIAPDTARNFIEFMKQRDVRGATVVIESDGGIVVPAMQLGRLFRQLGIVTTVGRTNKLPPAADGSVRAELSPAAICASMCPFLVLGGGRRYIPPQARVLVHQIWPRLKRDDAVAANYSAQDLVGLQRELGMLAHYVLEMGADIELYEIALRIPPWEVLRPLNADELRRLKLTNIDTAFPRKAPSDALDSAATFVPPATNPVEAADRAWTVIPTTGKRGFSRRHPLTIEGEPIGTFELAFSCGADGLVTVNYIEQRRSRFDVAGDRVAGVGLFSGKDNRLLLKVESSVLDPGTEELKSVANATVPATFLESLATTSGNALVIATQTRRKVRTVIRPGNTGFGDSFERTVAHCPKPAIPQQQGAQQLP